MAGELSSGILALMHIYKTEKRISMLVVKIESHFYKKATDKIKFICKDGDKISSAVKDTLETGEGKVVITNSKGYNKEGICVAEFNVHWSFKAKNKSPFLTKRESEEIPSTTGLLSPFALSPTCSKSE